MTNEDLYNLTLTILRKESRGNIIKPDRFSYLLRQCHQEYYNQQYEKWAVSQTITDSLRPFVESETLTFSSGVEDISDLTHTYKHASSAYTATAEIDLVTPKELSSRLYDELTQPTAANPVMVVGSTQFTIYPDTITSATLVFLKEADNDPFFDYYIDAQRNVQWMGVNGATYTLQASEVYRDGTATGTVTSINRELEWGDQDKINILTFLLEKLGVSLEAGIAQYATAKEQQQNVA